jgi:hypothetical protein
VGISYKKDNCESNPFMIIFDAPLTAFDLSLIEFPNEIRHEIMNCLDLVVSEYYFDAIKVAQYLFYK